MPRLTLVSMLIPIIDYPTYKIGQLHVSVGAGLDKLWYIYTHTDAQHSHVHAWSKHYFIELYVLDLE